MFNINSINSNMHVWNLALSYLISNLKYMNFLLLNPVFNFHTTMYSKYMVNFIIFFTVYPTEVSRNFWKYFYSFQKTNKNVILNNKVNVTDGNGTLHRIDIKN